MFTRKTSRPWAVPVGSFIIYQGMVPAVNRKSGNTNGIRKYDRNTGNTGEQRKTGNRDKKKEIQDAKELS